DVLEAEAGGAEQFVPVEALEQRGELGGVHPRGKPAADQAAHARARRQVDRDAMFLEPLDDPDVRNAARAAAAERDADAGPRLLRGAAGRDEQAQEDRERLEHDPSTVPVAIRAKSSNLGEMPAEPTTFRDLTTLEEFAD